MDAAAPAQQQGFFAKASTSFRGMFKGAPKQKKLAPSSFVELQDFKTHRKSDSNISTSTDSSSSSELESL
jgi:hypothetical protein